MRLTTEQRLRTLERDVAVLQDTLKLLHRLLKEQKQLIESYIVRKVAAANENPGGKGENARPAQELYTFVCMKRFDRLDRDIKKMRELIKHTQQVA